MNVNNKIINALSYLFFAVIKNAGKKISLATVLIIITTTANAQNVPLLNYRWTTIEASGDVTGRHENGFVEFEGKFYLIGGRGLNPVNVFDPRTNTWEIKGKPPLELHHFQAVVYDDAIYILGAMTGLYPKEKPVENIWIYYPNNDEWVMDAVIPAERQRGSAGAVLYNNKIYLVGGIEYGHTSGTNNYFDSYDLKTKEWELLTKAPNIRDHFPAIVVDDKLYCIGGRNTSLHHNGNFTAFFKATIALVDVYDFNTGSWHTLKDEIPYPTAAGGIVNIDNYILYMGGEGELKQAYNLTQCFEINKGEWTQLAPLNIGRHGSGAIFFNKNIYIAAGSQNQGGGNMNSIEVFSQNHNWQTLFNTNDLSGWEVKCTERDKDEKFWTVDSGSILCNSLDSKDHNYIWLQAKGEFDNFELRLKFQSSHLNQGNSGVQFRSRYDENAIVENSVTGWLDGPQVDINPNDPWRNGFIYDETREEKRWINPSLPDWNISKDKYAPEKVIHYFDDEGTGWNDMSIICNGMKIKTFVNNVAVSNYDGTGILDDDNHKSHNVGTKGHIALQLHKESQNLIRFKDIEIRQLK